MDRMKLIERALPYSKCGPARLMATWTACKIVDKFKVAGAFVECGVWRGGNVMVARWASPSRQCWAFDTFNGMTEPGPHDKHRDGHMAHGKWPGKAAVSFTEVAENLKKENAYDPKLCAFVVGDVRQTLLDPANLPEIIAVLRLDTDFYDSTKIELEVLYPRLAIGGVLLVDDYGHWMGARKAVDDHLGKSRRLLKPIDYSGVWMVKT